MTEYLRPTVLLVDDEPAILRLHREFLDEVDCDVLLAERGSRALEILASTDVQVLVSDHIMPGMRGAELLAEVRRGHPAVTTIMLTGHASLRAALSAINAGGVHRLLTKPCGPEVFIEAVTSALRYNRLLTAARSLADKEVRREQVLQELEAMHPGITQVKRTASGVIDLTP